MQAKQPKQTPRLIDCLPGFCRGLVADRCGRVEASGIVTRMGHDLGHGGEAIEPGAVRQTPEVLALSADIACPGRFQHWTQAVKQEGEATGAESAARPSGEAPPLGNTGGTTSQGGAA
jgi:hypothetical protein